MNKNSNNRFFLSLIPEESVINLISETQTQIQFNKNARLIPDKNFHITLLFLGEVGQDILEHLNNLGQDISSLELKLESLFLDKFIYWKRSKIAAIGSSHTPDFIEKLYKYFKNNLEHYSHEFFHDFNNQFTPHITLARNVTKQPVFPGMLNPIEFKINKLYLMQSIFHNNLVNYEVCQEFYLNK